VDEILSKWTFKGSNKFEPTPHEGAPNLVVNSWKALQPLSEALLGFAMKYQQNNTLGNVAVIFKRTLTNLEILQTAYGELDALTMNEELQQPTLEANLTTKINELLLQTEKKIGEIEKERSPMKELLGFTITVELFTVKSPLPSPHHHLSSHHIREAP